jgi:hypothetical protein
MTEKVNPKPLGGGLGAFLASQNRLGCAETRINLVYCVCQHYKRYKKWSALCSASNTGLSTMNEKIPSYKPIAHRTA